MPALSTAEMNKDIWTAGVGMNVSMFLVRVEPLHGSHVHDLSSSKYSLDSCDERSEIKRDQRQIVRSKEKERTVTCVGWLI
jgi:hypothetical protein